MPLTQYYASAPAHATQHLSGGPDALTGALDANARLAVAVSGVLTGTRRQVNLIPGTGVSFTVTDDGPNERVNVTISAASAGSQKRTGAFIVGLSTLATPSVDTGHILRVRAKMGATDSGSLLVWLYQGTTLISGPYTVPLTTSFATTALNIPSTDAANITSYSTLRVQIQGISDAAGTLTPQVSFVELETPT